MARATAERIEQVLTRLGADTPFYAANCLKIVNKAGKLVALNPNPTQLKFDAALEEQREQGRPMRAIVLKARQLGCSTWTQAKMFQRVTQTPHTTALTVAQNNDTAGELFAMSELFYANLPEEAALRPTIRNRRKSRELAFGEPSVAARQMGLLGLNSVLRVDNAREFEAGRGFVYRLLHGSEVAFWPDVRRKLAALLNAVPDEPETLVVLESTANGHNVFKELWEQAENGENEFAPIFFAWHEDPTYQRPFLSDEDREQFIEAIGTGPYGREEPTLVEKYGCTPEQLQWRRWAIQNRAQGDLRLFKQEYPANPSEAFLSTGRQVFSSELVSVVVEETKDTPPLKTGELSVVKEVPRRLRHGVVDVPSVIEWRDRIPRMADDPLWLIWEEPVEGGHYVIGMDAGGEESDDDEHAYHAIEVIDHRTRVQVAEWRSRIDPDLAALEVFKAGRYFNHAWIAVETTGGYGAPIAKRVWRELGYPRMYTRKSLIDRKEHQEDRLGWDTNRSSKAFLEDGAKEMLREGSHGIRSQGLALEMTWYVRLPNGRTGPEAGKFSDRLMAWMIAQTVAQEKPIPTDRKPGSSVSTTMHRVRYPKAGY